MTFRDISTIPFKHNNLFLLLNLRAIQMYWYKYDYEPPYFVCFLRELDSCINSG